ncbi:MAG: hypothetical protein AB7O57_18400 [Hyphomicrobiaceae bacterium]
MTKKPAKRGRGRPPKLDDRMVQITIRLPAEIIDLADAISAARLDKPERSVVLREALALGLEAMRKRSQ